MSPDQLNQQCIQRLQSANLQQRVLAVGSGPSSPYIAPISKLKELLSACCHISKQEDEKFWNFTQRAFESNSLEYYRVIRDTYQKTPHWSADIYTQLAAIPFCGFATFNYDIQLPKAIRARYPDNFENRFSVFPPPTGQTYWAALELQSPPPRLIALHGYSDPENDEWEKQIILRTSDYNKHYIQHPAILSEWWRNLLLSVPCLFVGTSLEEPGLFRVLEYLLKQQYKDRLSVLNHLHLIDVSIDPITGLYPNPKKSLGVIDRVYYDRIDDRYSGLLELLSRFSTVPASHPSPRVPAMKEITPTDNIDFDSLS